MNCLTSDSDLFWKLWTCVCSTNLWHSQCVVTSRTLQRMMTTSPFQATPSLLKPETSSTSKRFETHFARQLGCRNAALRIPSFLFHMQKFNNDWWIGRPVKEDGIVGFVPSPVNLETILIRREVQARKAAKALARCLLLCLSETSPREKSTWHLNSSYSEFQPAHAQTKHPCKVEYKGLYSIYTTFRWNHSQIIESTFGLERCRRLAQE